MNIFRLIFSFLAWGLLSGCALNHEAECERLIKFASDLNIQASISRRVDVLMSQIADGSASLSASPDSRPGKYVINSDFDWPVLGYDSKNGEAKLIVNDDDEPVAVFFGSIYRSGFVFLIKEDFKVDNVAFRKGKLLVVCWGGH